MKDYHDLYMSKNYPVDIESKIEFQTILFSPACSSYDQFKNFEERGDYFKTIINQFVNV